MSDENILPLSITERINLLSQDINSGAIPLFDGVNQSYILAAEKFDLQNSRLNAQLGLEQALESDQVKAAYNIGLSGGILPSEINMSLRSCINDMQSISDGANLVHIHFLRKVTQLSVDYHKNTHWYKVDTDMQSTLSKPMRGIAYLDTLVTQAKRDAKAVAINLLNPTNLRAPFPGGENDFFKERLKATKLSEGYVERVEPVINEKAQEIFGADAQAVLSFTRALIFMNTHNIVIAPGENHSKLRTPILQAIGNGDYAFAQDLLRAFILKQPNAFDMESKAAVGITREDLEMAKEERKNAAAKKREQIRLAGLQKKGR